MSGKPSSWKAVIDQRKKQNFVGREDELRLFSDNFVGDVPTYMLFAVTGEGGVGKSTLLNQYKAIVTLPGIGGLTIRCDEHQMHPVAAMSHIAEKLAERDIEHKDFEEWLKKYHDVQSKLGRDEKAPRSGIKIMSMGLSHFVLKTAKEVPGFGAFVDGVDTKAAGEALAELINYAIDRGSDKDEVELLSEPERKITPYFLRTAN